jgi:hypothetical protein
MTDQTNDAFQKWHTGITELFGFLEQAPNRVRTLGPPPLPSDPAECVKPLTGLWLTGLVIGFETGNTIGFKRLLLPQLSYSSL